MVDSFLGKKYKLASSENFEEFMKALSKSFYFIFYLNKYCKRNRYVQGKLKSSTT